MKMHIYCLPVSGKVFTAADQDLLPFVSEERRRRILSYRFDIDRRLSLYAALLCRAGLSILSKKEPYTLTFSNPPLRKPVLLSDPQYYFNVSHTRDFILCALSTMGEVGVDVERNVNPPMETMSILFHDAEINYVQGGGSKEQQALRFFKIWTQKEAYSKCLGTGLSESLTQVNTLNPSFGPHYYTWRQGEYVCSVYSSAFEAERLVRFVKESDISRFFINVGNEERAPQ